MVQRMGRHPIAGCRYRLRLIPDWDVSWPAGPRYGRDQSLFCLGRDPTLDLHKDPRFRDTRPTPVLVSGPRTSSPTSRASLRELGAEIGDARRSVMALRQVGRVGRD